mmetsp:Transcript_37408/g.119995  ORF Transcript_37408/g.119995 Transcript_37408/m.119995 type:complete len:90 (-) Transcript_37408:94-363(-)
MAAVVPLKDLNAVAAYSLTWCVGRVFYVVGYAVSEDLRGTGLMLSHFWNNQVVLIWICVNVCGRGLSSTPASFDATVLGRWLHHHHQAK